MKPDGVVIAGMIGGAVLTGATWVAAPLLAPASRKVESEAGVHVERARRLLHRYNAQLAYGALVRDQLRDAELDGNPVDTAPIGDERAATYEAIHGRLWEAFSPTDWGGLPRPARADYGNIAGQIRQGLRTREDLVSANAALLDEAIAEAGAAINVSSGDQSGRQLAEAQRIKAVALFHKALSEQLWAGKRRAGAEQIRGELLLMANDLLAIVSGRTLAVDSGIDEHIMSVEEAIGDARSRLAQYESHASRVDAEIRALETRLAEVATQADVAFNEMQRMQNVGVDFTDPQGAKNFTNKLMALADAYGVAVREAHIIEFGGYPEAEIDYTGDYIRGRYIQNGSPENVTMTRGLKHARQRRAILADKMQGEQRAIQGLHDDLTLLREKKGSYQQMETLAADTLAQAVPIATEAYDRLNKVEAEAVAVEDQALALLGQSIAAAKGAAAAAGRWSGDAGSRLAAMAPDAKSDSAFNARADDQWLAGFNNAQIADAQLAQASIHLARFKEAKRTAAVLESVTKMIELAEVDVSAEKAKAEQARKEGVAAVTEAAATLERAHRTIGRHWTLVAHAATVSEMLVQFGLEDYVADALAGYRNAIKGREDESFSKPFADRIRRLQDR